LISFEYPPETGFGGIGTYTWHHARALAALGHDVHVLAGARQPTPLRTACRDGVRVHRFRARGAVMRTAEQLGRLRLWWTRERVQNAWSMYRGLSALHREHAFDVLEVPECGADGTLITQLMRVPVVVRLHSPSRLIMPFYEVRRSDITFCAAVERPAMLRAAALTACSRFVAGQAASALDVQRPITVIPNGINLEWLDAVSDPVDVFDRHRLPRGRPLVVFTGRMERRKGIHLCTEIAGSLLARHDVTIALAGDDLFGYVSGTLLPALASRRLRGSVHWLGKLGLPEVRALVRACDVFLHPSLWENCPYSCLEAMAAGKAIVSSNQGGMPELIVHETNGLLATAGDAESFAVCVGRLIEDAALRKRLGAEARRTVETGFQAIDIARSTVGVYEAAMDGAMAGRS
jgi:glycosyltransferase involved in cell wall biosynthesis